MTAFREYWDRLMLAWQTLRNQPQAQFLLTGPLPLWMQEHYEREAERRGEPVGHMIFLALKRQAMTSSTLMLLQDEEGATVETPDGSIECIDAFMAPLVATINCVPGVMTTNCCSGHGSGEAYVQMAATDGDSRRLAQSDFIRALTDDVHARAHQPGEREIVHRGINVPSPRPGVVDVIEIRFDMRQTEADTVARAEAMTRERDHLVAICQSYMDGLGFGRVGRA